MSKTHKNELFYSQNWTNDVQNCHNKHKKGTKKSSTVQFNIFYSLPLIPVRLYSQQLVLNVRNTGRDVWRVTLRLTQYEVSWAVSCGQTFCLSLWLWQQQRP